MSVAECRLESARRARSEDPAYVPHEACEGEGCRQCQHTGWALDTAPPSRPEDWAEWTDLEPGGPARTRRCPGLTVKSRGSGRSQRPEPLSVPSPITADSHHE